MPRGSRTDFQWLRVEAVGVVRVVANQVLRSIGNNQLEQGGSSQFHFVGWADPRCVSCRSRPMISWISSPCIGCVSAGLMRRTAAVNQIRGLLLERGITLRKGRCHVDAALPGLTARRSRCAGSEDRIGERSLSTPRRDSWYRSAYSNSTYCSHRERSGLSQGPRVRSVGWVSSARALNRRQAKAAQHQQARELLLATPVFTGRTRRPAV